MREWKNPKRILSFLLVLTMVLQYVPSPAFAAESDNLCDHHQVHTAECHYAEAVAGQPCGHVCSEDCTEVCVHTSHDDACGYAPAAEAHECHYECAECAAALTAEGETDPATEPTTEPSTEVTEPEVVCTCESDDPEWHAPFCGLYVAPENPQCLCVEKCTEGIGNEWCEVCCFDPTACGASGQEEAAAYPLSQDADGYYLISTADDLYAFAELVEGGETSANGKLTANIVVNKNVLKADGTLNGDGSSFRAWTPIGNSSNPYIGTFDGGNQRCPRQLHYRCFQSADYKRRGCLQAGRPLGTEYRYRYPSRPGRQEGVLRLLVQW